jgi:hypothetical protein
MKQEEYSWELEVGLFPGIMFGFRIYEYPSEIHYRFYLGLFLINYVKF